MNKGFETCTTNTAISTLSDKKAIKKVIEDENTSFQLGNFSQWAECFVQNELTYISNSKGLRIAPRTTELFGWEEIAQFMQQEFQASPDFEVYVDEKTLDISLMEEMAFVDIWVAEQKIQSFVLEKSKNYWSILRKNSF